MRPWTLLAALALVGCPKTAPEPAADPNAATAAASQLPPPETPLPVDPDVRSGVLPNGMHWYIEVNQKPAKRAVFRMAVDAGSVLEDDDQRGVAHFLEHMAFNGSEHFEGNELIEYLESVGTRFGAHLNAHTSVDETVYKLEVPTDDPEVFDTAFTVFRDWAGGITNSDEEIEKERGVVLEEWRSRRGAGGPDRRRHATAHVQGQPLRGPQDHRHRGVPQDLRARCGPPVLRGLVPARPDGDHRGRRLRRGRSAGEDRGEVLGSRHARGAARADPADHRRPRRDPGRDPHRPRAHPDQRGHHPQARRRGDPDLGLVPRDAARPADPRDGERALRRDPSGAERPVPRRLHRLGQAHPPSRATPR